VSFSTSVVADGVSFAGSFGAMTKQLYCRCISV